MEHKYIFSHLIFFPLALWNSSFKMYQSVVSKQIDAQWQFSNNEGRDITCENLGLKLNFKDE